MSEVAVEGCKLFVYGVAGTTPKVSQHINISVSDSDPGSWLGKNPDLGSGINIPDNFFESLETILRDKNI